MSVETRTPEWRPGEWLVQCAFHPFKFWSSETWIDAEGKIRCKKFCGTYEGPRTDKEHSMLVAQAHQQREAPPPPRTIPTPRAKEFLAPWARWRMQAAVSRLEDSAYGHDGLPSPTAATLVDGRLGSKAFRFVAATAYEILNSGDANPQESTGESGPVPIGVATAAWVKIASGVSDGSMLSKGDGATGFDVRVSSDGTTGVLSAIFGPQAVGIPIVLGSWHHLAVGCSPLRPGQQSVDLVVPTFYVDGVIVPPTLMPVDSAVYFPNIVPLRVGDGLSVDMYDLRYFLRNFATGEVPYIMGGGS
jgi:hypothetical protein